MLSKKDIQIISRNSDLTKNQIDFLLQENVYNKPKDWLVFLKYFTLAIGISFLSIGILFFFAYNWQDLHKFFKLGIIEFLIVITTFLAVRFLETKKIVSHILLTSATLLVGVLFAVFGQIYQTGANAFDFFFGWTMAVFVWVLITKFEPLWLLFLLLINVTYFMFTEQVATDFSEDKYFFILLLINLPILLFLEIFQSKLKIKNWFLYTFAFYLILIGTIAVIRGVFNKIDIFYWINLGIILSFFTWSVIRAFKEKAIFYIAMVFLSIILIANSLIFKGISNLTKFFIIGVFNIICITILIKFILNLKTKWKNAT